MAALGLSEHLDVRSEHVRRSDEAGDLAGLVSVLPYIAMQPEPAQSTMLAKIDRWMTRPQSFDDADGWLALQVAVNERREVLKEQIPCLAGRSRELLDEGKIELRRRMSWDVQQAILSHVGAGRQSLPS